MGYKELIALLLKILEKVKELEERIAIIENNLGIKKDS
jgi:hypothetical protein|tara:strand:+ start:8891 stop:9004 length:114 start_codon:yes stop_codon:yes gene_type:complete